MPLRLLAFMDDGIFLMVSPLSVDAFKSRDLEAPATGMKSYVWVCHGVHKRGNKNRK